MAKRAAASRAKTKKPSTTRASRATGALAEYAKKRDFEATPEPAPDAPPRQGRTFVVQKHAARRLHYDFRLEHGGVLWSWAVPKGPSGKPGERRLAVRTEDHPVSYGSFEGLIPEGEYGGGPVLLWDRGEWEPLGDPDEQLRDGKLSFVLRGQRMRGRWTLVRTKKGDWLLLKGRDAHAAGDPEALVEEHRRSVASGRTLEEIAAPPARVDPSRVEGAVKQKVTRPKPELASLTDAPPRGDDWLHEIKLDGYRILAHVRRGKKVRLITRKELDYAARVPSVVAPLAALDVDEAWIDGELVVLRSDGTTDFGALARSLKPGPDRAVSFVAFDLLALDGWDLRPAPLVARKEALRGLIGQGHRIRYSEHVRGDGDAMYRRACATGAEGIVSKRADAPYRGRRSGDWKKIKCHETVEARVGGFTDPSGSRRGFGALLLGEVEGDALRYIGKVGTGFDQETLIALRARLEELEIDAPPFANPPTGREARGVHWCAPEICVRVRCTERTADGILRHASFEGEREDAPSNASKDDGAPRRVFGVRITSPSKVLWERPRLSKKDLATYLHAASERMLPHVRGRPLMFMRCPEGMSGECFYQKHRTDGMPEALRGTEVAKDEPRLFLEDREGLVSLAQVGALEVHITGARVAAPEAPDRIVLDLDPDEALSWSAVADAAHEVRELLEGVGLTSYCMSTGGKGLHVVAPITAGPSWRKVKAFTRAVAETLRDRSPARYTVSSAKSARGGRIYVDYLRNARGASAVAPYSTRAREGAPVALPIAWSEVEGLGPAAFSVGDALHRFEDDDPWAGYLELEQALPAV